LVQDEAKILEHPQCGQFLKLIFRIFLLGRIAAPLLSQMPLSSPAVFDLQWNFRLYGIHCIAI